VGRKIFLGWPYFAWSQGYDTENRSDVMREMLSGNNKSKVCKLLKENQINYVELRIQNPPDPNIGEINTVTYKSFNMIYENKAENYSIYDVSSSCKML
jgi:hypothetical protein